MRKYAIIDFSASSLSLLIAKIEGMKMESLLHTRTQLSFSTSIYEGRLLSDVEKLEIIESAEGLIDICRNNDVERVYAIASSTLSSLSASQDLFDLIKERLGVDIIRLDIAEEGEARLVANERYSILNRAVLADFGSISLKLYSFSNYLCTIPLGPLGLYKENVSEVIPSKKEAVAIKEKVRQSLDEANLPEEGFFENAVLAGAYSWAIYQLYASYYRLSHQHGEKIIQYKKLKKLCKYLVKQDNSRSLMILKNAPELMSQIIPAVILAKELLKRFGVSNIIVSDLGVKEGVLKQIVAGQREERALQLKG